MLDGASSTASARVSILSAPLLAAYGTMFGRPRSEASEQMLMILPRRRAFIAGSSARVTRNGPSRFAAISARHSSGVNSSSGLRWFIAALLTRMSIGPDARSTSRDARGDGIGVGDVERRDAGVDAVARERVAPPRRACRGCGR